MDRKEEIKLLIQTNGVKEKWLAEKLGFKRSTLHYILNESPQKLDYELYNQIKKLIEEFQYELNFIAPDKVEDISLFSDEELQVGLGERIRIFAKRKYGTLKKLASAMGISPQQLQQYISGNREPGTRILMKLLRLGCDINWLLGGSESAESYRLYQLEVELKKMQIGYKKIHEVLKSHNL